MSRGCRRSFTLMELLVTVAVIGILAAVVLGALESARESARVAKTQATIAKINDIVMTQYESYRTRRVPVDTRGMPAAVAAQFRVWAIRQIMRMEMPDRLSDVTYPANNPAAPVAADENLPVTFTVGAYTRALTRTSLARAYFRRFLMGMPSGQHSPAELLYLTVTLGTPGAREQFADNEIGDTDGDGYLEFLDGWNRPIYFIRQAPAFQGSEVQLNPPVTLEQAQADHDPFDSRNVRPGEWRLVPLIYSGGPDQKFGIDLQGGLVYQSAWATWYSSTVGAPAADTSIGEYPGCHLDNIHNHQILRGR